jgi:hypothetical protein
VSCTQFPLTILLRRSFTLLEERPTFPLSPWQSFLLRYLFVLRTVTVAVKYPSEVSRRQGADPKSTDARRYSRVLDVSSLSAQETDGPRFHHGGREPVSPTLTWRRHHPSSNERFRVPKAPSFGVPRSVSDIEAYTLCRQNGAMDLNDSGYGGCRFGCTAMVLARGDRRFDDRHVTCSNMIRWRFDVDYEFIRFRGKFYLEPDCRGGTYGDPTGTGGVTSTTSGTTAVVLRSFEQFQFRFMDSYAVDRTVGDACRRMLSGF